MVVLRGDVWIFSEVKIHKIRPVLYLTPTKIPYYTIFLYKSFHKYNINFFHNYPILNETLINLLQITI